MMTLTLEQLAAALAEMHRWGLETEERFAKLERTQTDAAHSTHPPGGTAQTSKAQNIVPTSIAMDWSLR